MPLPKVCTKCGAKKSLTDFYKHPTGKGGLAPTCRSCDDAKNRAWCVANKERRKAYLKAYDKVWCRQNRGIKSAAWRHREAAKLRAVPAWADHAAIRAIYEAAAITGQHVDHIVPLQSPLVCGLHVEANLQLLPPRKNISKGNRHWLGMS